MNWLSFPQETDSTELVMDSVEEHLMVDAIVTMHVTVGMIVAMTRFISVGKNMKQKTTWCPLLTCHQETTRCPVPICHQVSISFYFLLWKIIFMTRQTHAYVITNTQNGQYWHYCQFCIHRNLQFSSLFALHDASKCKIRYINGSKRITFEDYEIHCFCSFLMAKLKQSWQYCGEFVKTPLVLTIFFLKFVCSFWKCFATRHINGEICISPYITGNYRQKWRPN